MTGIDWLREGIHTIAPEGYHRDPAPEPALSAGLAHTLLSRSPKHAWTESRRLNPNYRERQRDSFDLGTAVHDLWLRGREDLVLVIDANDWRTKAAQEQKAQAHEAGLTPLLAKDWQRVKQMTGALGEQLAERRDDPPLFAEGGKPEQTVVWQERGIWCRALIDWVHADLLCCDDLKSCAGSANPFAWCRTTLWTIGGDLQAAMHSRAIRAVTGKRPQFRFLVCETREPYATSVVELAPASLEMADEKLDRAMDTWRECLATGTWPAYTKHVVAAEPPPWMESRWLEEQAIEGLAA